MENDFVAWPQGAGLDCESHAATSGVEGQTTARSPWACDPGLERSALWRGRPKRVGSSPCGEDGEEQAQAPLAGVPAPASARQHHGEARPEYERPGLAVGEERNAHTEEQPSRPAPDGSCRSHGASDGPRGDR